MGNRDSKIPFRLLLIESGKGMKMQKKVLISTLNLVGRGGVGTMAKFLYNFLEEKGYKPTLLYSSKSIADHLFLKTEIKKESPRALSIGSLFPPSLGHIHYFPYIIRSLQLTRIIKQYDIYQTVSGTALSNIPFWINKKSSICWIATTLREEWNSIYSSEEPSFIGRVKHRINNIFVKLTLPLEKRICKEASLILAISNYTAQALKKEYPFCKDKIKVIPVPVDTDVFRPPDFFCKQNERFLLCVARLDDLRKNISLLLRAFHEVKKRIKDVKLLLIGSCRKRQHEFKLLCSKLGIERSVSFLGHIENIIPYYQQAEVFVLPSKQEGLGIVVLEAMACGTPVIATRCGGPEEIVIDGVNGYLVPNNNDPQILSEKIIELLENKQLLQKMGENARKYVEAKYSVEVIGKKLAKIYRDWGKGSGKC